MTNASFSQTLQDAGMPPTGAHRRGSVLQVADGVFAQEQSIVNVVLVGAPGAGDGDWVLVDAGLPFSSPQIRQAAAELYGPRSRPAAIVLTHGHFDHVGALKTLAEAWDVPVFAHEYEMPYLTGRSKYPPPDPTVGGGAMSLLSPLFPRGPIDLGSRVLILPQDQTVPGMPGWRWIPTPGHTPGHVSFFRDSDRTLIVGDAFVTTRQESALSVLLRQTHVWRPPAYFTQDWQAAHDSVAELAALLPNAAITGHGKPIYGAELRRQLAALLDHWKETALPAEGRYVCQPAIANQWGTVAVPPAVQDRRLLTLACVAGGTLAGVLLYRALSGSRRRYS